MSDITDVRVIGERSRDDDTTVGGHTVRYRAELVTASGTIPLSSFHSRREQDFQELSERIRDLLALPTASPQDEAARLVVAGRMIDAVTLIRQRDGVDLTAAKAAADRIRDQIRKTTQ